MLSFAYWLDTCYYHSAGWGSSVLPGGCPDLFSLSLAEAGGSDVTYHSWYYCAWCMALSTCKRGERKAGKDWRLHKPEHNKQVPLKLAWKVFRLKFYIRRAFFKVLVVRSAWSAYLCFIKLVMKFVLFFIMKVYAVAYYMRQNRSHWCLSLGPNRHFWHAAHSSWAMSKQYWIQLKW